MLLLGGDIETNSGPISILPNIINIFSKNTNRNYNFYYYQKTIQFKYEIQHKAKTLTPFTNINHNHKLKNTLTHLQFNILYQLHDNYQPKYLTFTIITVIASTPNLCKDNINKETNSLFMTLLKNFLELYITPIMINTIEPLTYQKDSRTKIPKSSKCP